jgi:hypothetical protein
MAEKELLERLKDAIKDKRLPDENDSNGIMSFNLGMVAKANIIAALLDNLINTNKNNNLQISHVTKFTKIIGKAFPVDLNRNILSRLAETKNGYDDSCNHYKAVKAVLESLPSTSNTPQATKSTTEIYVDPKPTKDQRTAEKPVTSKSQTPNLFDDSDDASDMPLNGRGATTSRVSSYKPNPRFTLLSTDNEQHDDFRGRSKDRSISRARSRSRSRNASSSQVRRRSRSPTGRYSVDRSHQSRKYSNDFHYTMTHTRNRGFGYGSSFDDHDGTSVSGQQLEEVRRTIISDAKRYIRQQNQETLRVCEDKIRDLEAEVHAEASETRDKAEQANEKSTKALQTATDANEKNKNTAQQVAVLTENQTVLNENHKNLAEKVEDQEKKSQGLFTTFQSSMERHFKILHSAIMSNVNKTQNQEADHILSECSQPISSSNVQTEARHGSGGPGQGSTEACAEGAPRPPADPDAGGAAEGGAPAS